MGDRRCVERTIAKEAPPWSLTGQLATSRSSFVTKDQSSDLSSAEPAIPVLSFELNVKLKLSALQALEQIRRVGGIRLERFDEFLSIL